MTVEPPASRHTALAEILSAGLVNNLEGYMNNYLQSAGMANPVHALMQSFQQRKNSYWLNRLKVFDQVHYQGRIIDPKLTITLALVNADLGYRMIARRMQERLETLCTQTGSYNATHFRAQVAHVRWRDSFRVLLTEQADKLFDLSIWLQQLAKRQGKVGKSIRHKLAQYGITDTDALPSDVRRLSDNVIRFYDTYEEHQLRQYATQR